MKFLLDEDLTPVRDSYSKNDPAIIHRSVLPRDGSNKVVSDTLIPESDLYHTNYLEYLCRAYSRHLSIVITPDIVWNTVLSELAVEIASSPDAYGYIFTTEPDQKQDIIVETGDITHLPLPTIIAKLRDLVPEDADIFLPEFSTTGPSEKLAHYAAFADVCSPYYNYMTFCCGVRAIDVLGTEEDWTKVVGHLKALTEIFEEHEKVVAYLCKVAIVGKKLFHTFENPDLDWLADIIATERCGSGGEVACRGWWVSHMFMKDYTNQKPENTPTCVSKVKYKNLETQREFVLYSGIFCSKIVDDFYVPYFANVVAEVVAAKPKPGLDEMRIEKFTIEAKTRDMPDYTIEQTIDETEIGVLDFAALKKKFPQNVNGSVTLADVDLTAVIPPQQEK